MAVINGNGTPSGTFANDPLQKISENQIALDGFNSFFGEDIIIGNPPGNFSGGAGNDLAFGGTGNDILSGGQGTIPYLVWQDSIL